MPAALANGRYELREFVGKGAMGAVYRAHDVELDRSVAVKCLLSSGRGEARELAIKEARTVASLSHANIMRVFDILVAGDQTWIISEWLEGQTLASLPLPLAPGVVLAVTAQILEALAAAHAVPVIHRDIKPCNVMIGSDGRVTLIDFGVAFAPGISTGETMAGSLRYTDPRLLDGAAPDHLSDLFSAALLMIELMTGQTVLPDLAPLPLYRYAKRHLKGRLSELLDGGFPPLVSLARDLTSHERLAPAGLGNESGHASGAMRGALARLTVLPPEIYLKARLAAGSLAVDADEVSQRIAAEAAAAVRNPQLTPKQKATWVAFKGATATNTSPATPQPKPRRRRRRALRQKLNAMGLAIGSAGAAAACLTLAARFGWLAPKPPPALAALPGLDFPVAQPPPMAPEFAWPLTALPPAPAELKSLPKAAKTTAAKATAVVGTVAVQLVANAWAVVTIDGHEVGRLPQAAAFLLTPGRHKLKLSNPVVEPLETEIHVRNPTRLRFSLTPKTTPRRFVLASPGRLFVDGLDLGLVSDKTVSLSYGTHQVWVQRTERTAQRQSVAVGPDGARTIVLQ